MRRALSGWVGLLAVAALAAGAEEHAMKVTLVPGKAVKSGSGWSVPVTVTFTNDGKKVFALDKVTAGLSGGLSNHVFQVKSGGKELDYKGMMAKRAPPGPNGFERIAPGKSVSVALDLGGSYDFPSGGGEFTVAFSSFNHFSEDAVQLESVAVPVVLKP